jgi:hypothetical protein
MTATRFWQRRVARRITAVDAFEFPSSVRLRFSDQHRELSVDGIRTVEAALRQWFRLAARHPKTKVSMPSVVVDDMWHGLVLHTREYAAFCEAAFGRFLHHGPEAAMSSPAAAANRTAWLLAALQLAREDEGCGAHQLPLLFRVDKELGVDSGRRYLADCGGRGQCYEVPGTLCLQHLTGMDKPVRGGSRGGRNPAETEPIPGFSSDLSGWGGDAG